MMRQLMNVATAAALVLGLSSAARADHDPEPGRDKLIDVSSTYIANPTPDGACGGFRVVGSGSAVGRPLGDSDDAATWADAECANFVASPGQIVIDGTITLTDEHGAKLVLNYHVVSPLPDATATIYPQGTFTVDGANSTGRFKGATGSGTLTVEANLITSQATAHAVLLF